MQKPNWNHFLVVGEIAVRTACRTLKEVLQDGLWSRLVVFPTLFWGGLLGHSLWTGQPRPLFAHRLAQDGLGFVVVTLPSFL
jgi:hypothetical protein